MRKLLVITVLMLCVNAWSQDISQSAPKKKPDSANSKAEQHKRGTKEQPLVIEVLPSISRTGHAENEQKRHTDNLEVAQRISADLKGIHQESTYATILTITLAVIAFLQGGFFVYQLILMTTATKDAGDAAKAATISANSAKAMVEATKDTAQKQLRAYVLVEDIFFDWELRDVPGSDYTNNLRIRFKNYGQTPAILVEILWKQEHSWETKPIERMRDFGEMTLPPSARFGRPLGSTRNYGHQDMMFRVSGRFTYCDIYKEWHTVRFRYIHHWDGSMSVFTPFESENYETDHKTREEALAAA